MPEPLAAMHMGNLYADAEPPLTGERFESILAHQNLVVERIVSSADTAPMEYMQHHDEWVALLQGEAILEVAGNPVELHSGDYLFLPAETRHVVRRVTDGAVWLAVHLHPSPAGGQDGA